MILLFNGCGQCNWAAAAEEEEMTFHDLCGLKEWRSMGYSVVCGVTFAVTLVADAILSVTASGDLSALCTPRIATAERDTIIYYKLSISSSLTDHRFICRHFNWIAISNWWWGRTGLTETKKHWDPHFHCAINSFNLIVSLALLL